MKFTIRLLTILTFMSLQIQSAFAKDLVSSFDLIQNEAFSRYSMGNEFMAGQETGVVMMKVNLWGAVKKPGIHHIPVKTDLISLMSYAGGPNDNAIMDDVVIKRQQGQSQRKISVDLSQVIHAENNYDLTLQPNDIVVVSAKKPWISQDSFMAVILASTIASTILTIALISEKD